MKDSVMPEKNPDTITTNLIGEIQSMLPHYMAALTGMQFKNHRDFYTIFGWERIISAIMCNTLYQAHGIAKAVNDTPVDTTWRYHPKINSGSKAFDTQINALDKRIKLFSALQTADRVSGIGRFGIIVLGIKGQDYETPLRKFNIEDLVKLEVFQESEVGLEMKVSAEDKDDTKKTRYYYGIEYYKVGVTRIHPSRVIHIAENTVDGIYGQSRLLPIFNQLHDMWKISGSTAEQFYISASLLLSAQGIDGFKIKKEDGVALQDSLLELVNRMKGFLVSNGFDIKNIAPKIVSPKDSWEVMEKFISATSRIPRRILFGSEMGQLASTQDQNNYYERIESRQKNYVTECIINVLIDKLIAHSNLFTTTYEVEWHKLSSLSDKEVSESVNQYADSAKKLFESEFLDDEMKAIISDKIKEMIKTG